MAALPGLVRRKGVQPYGDRRAVHLTTSGAKLVGAGEAPPALRALVEAGRAEFVQDLRLGDTRVPPPVPRADEAAGRFTFVDLFAGIGGFRYALEQHGGRCALSSEIDTDCQGVLD